MSYSEDLLCRIHGRHDGHCSHCGKQVPFKNYAGRAGHRGEWEVDHGEPKSRGGVDDLRNLRPSCVPCNRQKNDKSTTEYRRFRG
jgi:5-methylcytosine-specific restriction protein A